MASWTKTPATPSASQTNRTQYWPGAGFIGYASQTLLRAAEHPRRVLGSDGAAREQRPEQASVDPEHDAEDAIAGKTGNQSADKQDDRRRKLEGRRKHQPAIIVVEALLHVPAPSHRPERNAERDGRPHRRGRPDAARLGGTARGRLGNPVGRAALRPGPRGDRRPRRARAPAPRPRLSPLSPS